GLAGAPALADDARRPDRAWSGEGGPPGGDRTHRIDLRGGAVSRDVLSPLLAARRDDESMLPGPAGRDFVAPQAGRRAHSRRAPRAAPVPAHSVPKPPCGSVRPGRAPQASALASSSPSPACDRRVTEPPRPARTRTRVGKER